MSDNNDKIKSDEVGKNDLSILTYKSLFNNWTAEDENILKNFS